MARIQNVLFGKLAVSTRFITESQLEECLQEQRRLEASGEQPPRLGELLEQKGYLTKQQIRSILETMASMQRRLFGEIAIAFHFITLEQLQTALDVQRFLKSPMDSVPLFGQALIAYRDFLKTAHEGGPVPKIGEILVAMGYLKEHQVQVILQEQNKKIVQCKSCGAGLNIGNYGEGQKLRCGQCSSVLILARNQFGELDATLPQEEEPLPQVTRRPTEVHQMFAVPAGAGAAAAPAPTTRTKTSVTTRPSQVGKTPTQFGEFTIQGKLGQDSTGTLYKAQWTAKQRTVVVKIMNQTTMQDAAFAKRFTEEARKAAGIAHPNIKKVWAIGQVDGKAYIAMEYVEGESVHAILTRQTRIHHTQALRIGKKIAEALKFAWDSSKIVHGDIRPSNILILKTGEVMLSNLGLATKTAENILTIAKSGQLAPFYLAPEHVTEDRAIDCRSDIYSLGATLYHMIAGRPPYQGQSPFEVLVRLTEERVAPLKFFDATIPDAVCIVVEKMLAVEPDERYASYDDLIGDLSKIAEVSADVDASMLLGEKPSKHRKTTVTLAAIGGAEASVGGDGSTATRKRTTTVIRGGDSAEEAAIAPPRSSVPVLAILVGVPIALIAGYFILTGNKASEIDDADFAGLEKECIALEGQGNYDAIKDKCKEFLDKHPRSSHANQVQSRSASAERHKSGAVDDAFETMKKRILQTARESGIPAAKGLIEPGGGLPPVLAAPQNKDKVEALAKLIQDLAQQMFEESKSAAWVLAKDKKDFETARAKLTEGRNHNPDYGDKFDEESKKIEQYIKDEAAQATAAADAAKKAESQKRLDKAKREIDDMMKAWDFEHASALCGSEAQYLVADHQKELAKVQEELNAMPMVRQEIQNFWNPKLADQNPAPDKDQRPVLELDGKGYRLFGITNDLIELKEKDQKPVRKPWKEVSIGPFYEQVLRPAIEGKNGDLHLALGHILLLNDALSSAEREFIEARNQGKDVKPYTDRIDQRFSAKAEEVFKSEQAFLKASQWRDALGVAVTLRREYGTRSFCKDHAGEIADATAQALKAIAGGGEVYSFRDPKEWDRWTKSGNADVVIAGGALTITGSKGGSELKAQGVAEVLLMLQLPDAKTKITIQLGSGTAGYKMQFNTATKKVTCQGPRGLQPISFAWDADRWIFVRIEFASAKVNFYVDEDEKHTPIYAIPEKAAPDDVSLFIEGSGGPAVGKALLSDLMVRHEK